MSKRKRELYSPRLDIITKFRPCRMVLRPKECNSNSSCWVENGALSLSQNRAQGPKCTGCHGLILLPNAAWREALIQVVDQP